MSCWGTWGTGNTNTWEVLQISKPPRRNNSVPQMTPANDRAWSLTHCYSRHLGGNHGTVGSCAGCLGGAASPFSGSAQHLLSSHPRCFQHNDPRAGHQTVPLSSCLPDFNNSIPISFSPSGKTPFWSKVTLADDLRFSVHLNETKKGDPMLVVALNWRHSVISPTLSASALKFCCPSKVLVPQKYSKTIEPGLKRKQGQDFQRLLKPCVSHLQTRHFFSKAWFGVQIHSAGLEHAYTFLWGGRASWWRAQILNQTGTRSKIWFC